MLIDSTVAIDFLGGRKSAVEYLSNLIEDVKISRIVFMEIIMGCRTKLELTKTKKTVTKSRWKIIEVSEKTSQLAGAIFENFYHSNGLGMADALIAATTLTNNEKFATHNVKHFKFIKDLELIIPY